jgi:uncharacterized membrane-anchored protein YhcB (DUF1043 family)
MFELDGTYSLWIVGILGILLGIGLGSIVTYTLASRGSHNKNLQAELDQLAERFTEYREQVAQHFMQTSNLVQEMTQSYRAVYEHLASGAYRLCGEDTETPSLRHEPGTASDDDMSLAETDADYDELEELSSLRNDIDSLLKESPRFSKVDVPVEETEHESIKH